MARLFQYLQYLYYQYYLSGLIWISGIQNLSLDYRKHPCGTASSSVTIFTWVLFMPLMHLVNNAHLNTTCVLFLLDVMATSSASCPASVLVPFRSIYASLYSQRLDIIMVVWLIWLWFLFTSSFSSTHFFVLNLIDWSINVIFS